MPVQPQSAEQLHEDALGGHSNDDLRWHDTLSGNNNE
jgi:hypothetical protein